MSCADIKIMAHEDKTDNFCENGCRKKSFHHVSVMVKEVLSALDCRPGKIYVDCTLGGAGHSREILNRILPGGRLIGIDQDRDALDHAATVLGSKNNVTLFHGNYSRIGEFLDAAGIQSVDGILADLGVSLYQIQGSGRGFSFREDAPLDMRMDAESGGVTAETLVNESPEEALARIFWEYGEERQSRRIAKQIVRHRRLSRIQTTAQLSEIICKSVPVVRNKKKKGRMIHPATRSFMALRIAVNQELDHLTRFMAQVPDLLNPGGRLCVISFHSLEDRIVKHRLRELEKSCTCPPAFPRCVCNGQKIMKALNRKVMRPTSEEVAVNPMSRSASLRSAVKLDLTIEPGNK